MKDLIETGLWLGAGSALFGIAAIVKRPAHGSAKSCNNVCFRLLLSCILTHVA